MSYEPPTPPADLPTDVIDTLNDYSPELLRDVARYAEDLGEIVRTVKSITAREI